MINLTNWLTFRQSWSVCVMSSLSGHFSHFSRICSTNLMSSLVCSADFSNLTKKCFCGFIYFKLNIAKELKSIWSHISSSLVGREMRWKKEMYFLISFTELEWYLSFVKFLLNFEFLPLCFSWRLYIYIFFKWRITYNRTTTTNLTAGIEQGLKSAKRGGLWLTPWAPLLWFQTT